MASLITSLHQSLNVTPSDDGNAQVTVSIPSDLLDDYIGLLESLSGFVNAINHQKHIAKLHAASEQTKEGFQFKASYHKQIVKDYDRHLSQGLTRKEAIKRISADLRKDKHPWRCPDLIRSSLIEAGRPGRVGRPRRQS
jgi:hypothetical protein